MLHDLVSLFGQSSDVDVYSFGAHDESFYDLDRVARRCVSVPFRPALARWFTNPYIYTPIFALDVFRLVHATRSMAAKINRLDYDFVLLHHDRFTQNMLAPGYLRHPTVAYIQEPFRFFSEPAYDIDRKMPASHRIGRIVLAPFHRALESASRAGIAAADFLWSNSAYTREYVYKVYGRWSDIAYLGIDTDTYVPTGETRSGHVLSIGAINWRKQHALVVRALGQIPRDQRPPLVIVSPFIGNKGEYRRILGTAEELGVQCTVETNVSTERLVRVYNTALATVCASIMEPFGLVPLESMACGTPVVAVREGGYRETVLDGHTGLLTGRSPGEIAHGIRMLKDDDALRQRMGRNGVEHVTACWSWRVRFPAMQELLRRMLITNATGEH